MIVTSVVQWLVVNIFEWSVVYHGYDSFFGSITLNDDTTDRWTDDGHQVIQKPQLTYSQVS